MWLISGIINEGHGISRYWSQHIMLVRTAAGKFTDWLFTLWCQFVFCAGKVKVACRVNRNHPRGVLLPTFCTLTEKRNFLTHKYSGDTSYRPSARDMHKNTHTYTHTILKAILIEFPIVNSSVFSPCSNDIFLRLFHKSRHKPPANLSWAQRGPCHILGDDRHRRVLQ